MQNKWNKRGNAFYNSDASDMQDNLENGIYSLEIDRNGILYLEKLQDKYEFGYKLYGIQNPFIDRIVKLANHDKANLGILLNGIKGTGKSVTCKELCNRLELPVILINKYFNGIPEFINSIQQRVVIFADEFEKVFATNEGKDATMLTIMDGAFDNGNQRIFLLTTNNLIINDNLIDRPGRIRYLKKFSDLDKDTIELIIDDCLEHKEFKQSIIDYVKGLNLITIDIVKTIIKEVNLFKESPDVFKNILNIKEKQELVQIFKITDNGDKILIQDNINLNTKILLEGEVPKFFGYVAGIGDVVFNKMIDKENNIFEVVEEYPNDEMLTKSAILKMEVSKKNHYSFK